MAEARSAVGAEVMRQFAGCSADEGKAAAAALCLTATTTLEQIGNYNNTEICTHTYIYTLMSGNRRPSYAHRSSSYESGAV